MTQEPTGDDTEALIREKQIEELNAKLKESLDQYAESLKRAAELSVAFPLDTTSAEFAPWLVSHIQDAQGMRFPGRFGVLCGNMQPRFPDSMCRLAIA